MVKIHATEADRLIHMIRTCKCEDELRSFWSWSQRNPFIAHPEVLAAKDRRKKDLAIFHKRRSA